MGRNYERINELVEKIFNGSTCIYTYDHIAPETFATDIATIFGADVETDVLRNVLVGDEDGLIDSIFVILPTTIDCKELFIKLADYVNGTGMKFALCCCKDKNGVYRNYEIDLDDEYVEGGQEPFIDVESAVTLGEYNILLPINQLEFGADKNILPSPTVMFINQGEHYIKHLIGPNDEELLQ